MAEDAMFMAEDATFFDADARCFILAPSDPVGIRPTARPAPEGSDLAGLPRGSLRAEHAARA